MARDVSFTIKTSSVNVPEPKSSSGSIIIWPYIPLQLLLFLALIFGLLAFTDIDGDGLSNFHEVAQGLCRTNPFNMDTDGDGIPDTEEKPAINACLTATPTLPSTAIPMPTATLMPTLASTLTRVFIPPRPTDCGILPSPLLGYGTGRVLGALPNRVRSGTLDESGSLTIGNDILTAVLVGDTFKIVSRTPRCASINQGSTLLRWWNIEYKDKDGNVWRGWMADTDTDGTFSVEGVGP